MRTADELRRAGVDAAREARALLADLASPRNAPEGRVQAPRRDGSARRAKADPALAESVPAIVATLYATEIGDAAKVLDALSDATQRMRALLDVCGSDQRTAGPVSRALALLHPVRSELARALGREVREDATAPFLLTSSRVKASTPPEGEDERRDELRLELDVDVGLEGDNTFFTGRTGDLSKGGLFVGTDEPLPVGTELLLSFVLPDGYRVRADGVVAWVRAPRYRPDELPAGMGVRFVELSSRDQHAITHFLSLRPAFRYGD